MTSNHVSDSVNFKSCPTNMVRFFSHILTIPTDRQLFRRANIVHLSFSCPTSKLLIPILLFVSFLTANQSHPLVLLFVALLTPAIVPHVLSPSTRLVLIWTFVFLTTCCTPSHNFATYYPIKTVIMFSIPYSIIQYTQYLTFHSVCENAF